MTTETPVRYSTWLISRVSLSHRDLYHRFTVHGDFHDTDGKHFDFIWAVPLADAHNPTRYDFSRAEWTPDALAEYRRLYPERALVLIPPADDDRRLRHVEIDARYRLILWDTYRQSQPGRALLGFSFWDSTDEREAPLFLGEDFGPSPLHAIDSDASILALLSFLTCSTDLEEMTDRQREWYESGECDELSGNRTYIEEEGDACMDGFILDLEDSPVFEEASQ